MAIPTFNRKGLAWAAKAQPVKNLNTGAYRSLDHLLSYTHLLAKVKLQTEPLKSRISRYKRQTNHQYSFLSS